MLPPAVDRGEAPPGVRLEKLPDVEAAEIFIQDTKTYQRT